MTMAEPTTTSTAAAWAVAAGLVSAFLASIGVSWPTLFFATLGSLVGSGFAPTAGRLRAVAMFPASSMLSAKAGIVAAAYVGSIGAMTGEALAQAAAGAIGVLFHPLVLALARALPAAASARIGAPPEPRP